MIVEFARAWQEEQGAAVVDPAVVAAVRGQAEFDPADPDDALVRYGNALLDVRVPTDEGRGAPRQLRLAWQALLWIAPALGVLLGAGFVAATLPTDGGRTVNLFAVLAEGVLVPTLFGIVTATLALGGGGRLASAHWAAWLLGAMQRPALDTTLGRLAGRTLRRSGVAGPLLTGLSHRVWIGLLVGFVLLGGWRLTFEDHRFSWGSTGPLTAEAVETTWAVLAAPVAWLPGVDAPDATQVAVSEWDSLRSEYAESSGDAQTDEALRKGWYGLVLAAIAFWGLLPRLLAAGWGEVAVRRGIRRALESPGHAAVRQALVAPVVAVERPETTKAPPASPAPPADGPAASDVPVASAPAPPAPGPSVAAASHGLDLVLFATPAPTEAALEASGLQRLGLSGESRVVVDDADDAAMDAVVAALGSPSGPGGAVVVFRCADTPDRLRGRFLADVAGALGPRPLHLLLSGVDAFAQGPRGARLQQRLAGWSGLAAEAGLPPDHVRRDDGVPL